MDALCGQAEVSVGSHLHCRMSVVEDGGQDDRGELLELDCMMDTWCNSETKAAATVLILSQAQMSKHFTSSK